MNEHERTLHIVHRTRAIRWWIDRQIESGRTDQQIEAELPAAVAFITERWPAERRDEETR